MDIAVDVLLATYNGEKYLNEQIDSILNQENLSPHIYISDDGSSDSTVDIINDYVVKYPDRITVVSGDNCEKGAKNNFFRLLKSSKSDYIMFADQDDVWISDKVYRAVSKLREFEEIVADDGTKSCDIPLMYHSDLMVTDADLGIICESMAKMQKLDGTRTKFANFLVQNNATGCTMAINRALANKCYNMPKEAIMHDWWIALIASAFGKVIYDDVRTIYYRQHGDNTEGAKDLRNIKYILDKLINNEELRSSIAKTYAQAKAFKMAYKDELTPSKLNILNAYLSMEKSGKLSKLKTKRKYGFTKSGFVRELGYKVAL